MSEDRALSEVEVAELGLPQGACCCPDHGHGWYERDREGLRWYECNHCSDWRKVSR